MPALETWELASYVVTVIGLPMAIALFLYSDNDQDFLKIALDNPDLGLISAGGAAKRTPTSSASPPAASRRRAALQWSVRAEEAQMPVLDQIMSCPGDGARAPSPVQVA